MPHQCTNCGRTFDDGSKEMLSGCPDCGGNKFQFQPAGRSRDRSGSAPDSSRPAPDSSSPASDSSSPAPDNSPAPKTEPSEPEQPPDTGAAERADPTTAAETEPDQDGVQVDTTAEEDRAQRDARSTPTTPEEIDESRRQMTESERHSRSGVADEEGSSPTRPKRGRGTPQGPPTEPPDDEATDQFDLSGAVGPSDEQPAAPEEEPAQSGTRPASGEPDGSSSEATVSGPETDLSALREELNDQFESIKITAPGQYELNLMELYDRKEYIISLQEDGRYVVDIPEGHNLEE